MKSMEAAKAIIGSCASLIVVGATDDETAKLVQARVGEGRWIETRETAQATGSQNHTAAGIATGALMGLERGIGGAARGAMLGYLGTKFSSQVSRNVTTTHEARVENLASAERLAQLGPTREGNVIGIGVIAQASEGELRDVIVMRQIPYLAPSVFRPENYPLHPVAAKQVTPVHERTLMPE
jgi:hypothetical protein